MWARRPSHDEMVFHIFLIAFCIACIKLGEPFSGLPPGSWRGVLYISEDTTGFDEKSNGELPFNFDVVYDNPDSFHIVIHNGEEDIVVNDIRMGTDRRTGHDTIWIDFPVYDSHIKAEYEEDAMEGWWVARNRKDYQIKFKALHGKDYRFFANPDPVLANITGRWECNFEIETDHPYRAIGEFKQVNHDVTGTFITLTGDDRYLQGSVSADRLLLSVFDGSHAYLYEAKILADGTLSGIYRSGKHYKTYWDGKRNDSIQLKDLGDPMQQTFMKESQPFTVSLKTPEGETVTLEQPPYAGNPKIIQIMGTWCPNCRDETDFLLDYLKQHPGPGFEILGISFERHTDSLKAIQAIRTYRDKLAIPYKVVYGGDNNKENASKKLPMLNKVVAFPTLLFLSKSNRVVAIHTGYTGPATTEFANWKKEFDVLVEKMKTAP